MVVVIIGYGVNYLSHINYDQCTHGAIGHSPLNRPDKAVPHKIIYSYISIYFGYLTYLIIYLFYSIYFFSIFASNYIYLFIYSISIYFILISFSNYIHLFIIYESDDI